jgi:hypothetical protein
MSMKNSNDTIWNRTNDLVRGIREDNERGKPNYSGETGLNATLSTMQPTRTIHGKNPDLRRAVDKVGI